LTKVKDLANGILNRFSGPHTNKFLGGYVSSGTYVYANLGDAQGACEVMLDCGGITQESITRYTLRKGVELIGSITGETSWLKVSFNPNLCDQLLQQFHRVDEELSIQGKWQGGSVTGVCRGWGTNKVRSSVNSLGRLGIIGWHALMAHCSFVSSFYPSSQCIISSTLFLAWIQIKMKSQSLMSLKNSLAVR
jgi:hypothetical protein